MTKKPYNTRIAPSPTGDMHIGTARTAYFNYLAARATGGEFILRIDDTDIKRSNSEHTKVILETFEWLGLEYDKIIYQSKRFDRYKSMANALVSLGIALEATNGAIILKDRNPLDLNLIDMMPETWHDELNSDVTISDKDRENISGLVLIKSDGSPTYNWASMMDDHDYGINYVIRGHDHISNTCKQLACYYAMGAIPMIPKYAHVGLIHHKKKKLSKRDGAASMLYYKEQGYDPDAMLNFMLRLGWGPTIDDKTTKLISKERAIELFVEGGKMRPAPSNMDLNMLEAFDRKYKAQKGVWRNKDKLITENE